MQIIFAHELVTIKHDSKNHLLFLHWEGYITSEDYVKIMRHLLEFTHQLKIERWLSDARQADEIQMGDMSWTINHMYDYLKGSSLTKIARVIQPNNSSQPNVDKLINSDRFQKQQQVSFQIFYDLDAAVTWLAEPIPEKAAPTKVKLGI